MEVDIVGGSASAAAASAAATLVNKNADVVVAEKPVSEPVKLKDDVVTLSGDEPPEAEPDVGTGLPPTPAEVEPPTAEPDVGTGLPPTPAASTSSEEQSIGTGLPDRP